MKKKIELTVKYSFDWEWYDDEDEENYDSVGDIAMDRFYDDPSDFDSVEVRVDGKKVC